MNIKSVLTAHVYKKALRLSNQARRNRQIGEIVNLMAIDVQRFQDITTFMMLFWSSPLQVGLNSRVRESREDPCIVLGYDR